MSFAETHKKADDAPNAFKLALRIAQAASQKKPIHNPNKGTFYGATYDFIIDAPKDCANLDLALTFLESALDNAIEKSVPLSRRKTENLAGRHCIVGCHDEEITISLRDKDFPLHNTLHKLNRIQAKLGNSWIKESDGNYCNSLFFKQYPRIWPYTFGQHLGKPTLTHRDSGTYLYPAYKVDGTLEDIDKLPRSHASKHPIGISLNQNDIVKLSCDAGFLNPARPKVPSR
jgi:hypothetical protein